MGNKQTLTINPKIVNSVNDLEETYFIGIISCQRYKNRRDVQKKNLEKLTVKYKYFVGDKNLTDAFNDIENNIVYLPCEDNYESLPQKVHCMIKWVTDNYPDVKYLIKMDDDVVINNYNLMYYYLKYFSLSKEHYAGSVIKSVKKSFHHAGKSDTNKMDDIPVLAPKTLFAQGPFYFLSKQAMNIALNDMLKNNTIFEDQSIGYCLNQKGILPFHFNLKNCMFWPK